MKKQLEQHLLLHDPGPHVFDNIQKSIWALMETDCYPRFLESDLYKDYQKSNSFKTRTTTHHITAHTIYLFRYNCIYMV